MNMIIHGQPITKKNSQQIIIAGKRPCIIPSQAYKKYAALAKSQLCLTGSPEPLQGPLSVRCLYYLETARLPDLCNLLAATHDILELCRVIENDSQIRSVDGSRIMGKDAARPRVEIQILPYFDLPLGASSQSRPHGHLRRSDFRNKSGLLRLGGDYV